MKHSIVFVDSDGKATFSYKSVTMQTLNSDAEAIPPKKGILNFIII